MDKPITVTVTGAAGSIGYSLLFRSGAGRLFGPTVPIRLRLLEVPEQIKVTHGIAMEIDDCTFPLLESVDIFDDPHRAFDGASLAVLIGARPRTVGMERRELLEANGAIFVTQGQAINAAAASDIRVLTVGNPANTNALIAASHAPDVPKDRFTALSRLDHNRAVSQLAKRAGVHHTQVRRMAIWGNHSDTQYPDVFHAEVAGRSGAELAADTNWLVNEYILAIAHRGTTVLETRGESSQASAAHAVIDHIRDWYGGTAPGDWTSAAVCSRGQYGVPEGLVCSFPVTSDGTGYDVVPGIEQSQFARERIAKSVAELLDEREAVRTLGFID